MKNLITYSQKCSFINNSSFDILKKLKIDFNDTSFAFNLEYYQKEYNEQEYIKNLKTQINQKDNLLICDRMLFEDIRQINEKAEFFGDFILNTNFNDFIKHNFQNFNIAIYHGMNDCSYVNSLLNGVKIINFDSMYDENGYKFLGFNEELGFKIASHILFDAYDSGADFLVVDDGYSFYMFDQMYNKLKQFSNRECDDFYILSFTELVSILLGIIPNSFSKHKMKVRFL